MSQDIFFAGSQKQIPENDQNSFNSTDQIGKKFDLWNGFHIRYQKERLVYLPSLFIVSRHWFGVNEPGEPLDYDVRNVWDVGSVVVGRERHDAYLTRHKLSLKRRQSR